MAWFIAAAIVAAIAFILLAFYALATVSARADANAEAAFTAMRHRSDIKSPPGPD